MVERNTGRTARQMLDAPRGATFVWCNGKVHYPIALARALGRHDLAIVPLAWLSMKYAFDRPADQKVVIDHAVGSLVHVDSEHWRARHILELRGCLA